jgi:hypothetical protein
MPPINYLADRERASALVLNRPLKEFITSLGLDPTGDAATYLVTLAASIGGGGGLGEVTQLELDTAIGLINTELDSINATLLTKADLVGGLVPIAQIASGVPDGTKFVRDDGTLAIPPGGGGGGITQGDLDTAIDTHEASAAHDTRYYTEAEVDALVASIPQGPPGTSYEPVDYTLDPNVSTLLIPGMMNAAQVIEDLAIAILDRATVTPQNQTAYNKVLAIGGGLYQTQQPIVLKPTSDGAAALTIKGAHKYQTLIITDEQWDGPMWSTFAKNHPFMRRGPALLSGEPGTLSLNFDTGGTPTEAYECYYPFHYSPHVALHGLTNFTFDFTIQFWGLVHGSVMSTQNARWTTDVAGRTVEFEYSPATGFRCWLHIGGTFPMLVLIPAPVVDQIYHVSVDYNGANLWGYVDAVVVAGPTAVSGTLQSTQETVEVGKVRRSEYAAARISPTDPTQIYVDGGVMKWPKEFRFTVYGVEVTIPAQNIAFTAGVHDIANPGSPREAWYVLSANSAGVIAVTKGPDAVLGAAIVPIGIPAGHAAFSKVKVAHNGTLFFDATTDSLAASHLRVTYVELQPLCEDWVLGRNHAGVFEWNRVAQCNHFNIQNIRVSKSARYAGVHTGVPTTSYVWDTNCHMLLTMQEVFKNLYPVARIKGTQENQKFYIPPRHAAGSFMGVFTFEDMAMGGGGRNVIFNMNGAVGARFQRLSLGGSHHMLWDKYSNCFTNYTEECDMDGGTTRSLLSGINQCGVGEMRNCTFAGGLYQWVDVSSSMDMVYNCFFNGSNDTKMTVFSCTDGESTTARWYGNLQAVEAGNDNLEAGMGFHNTGSWSVFSGTFESATKPVFKFDGHRAFNMYGGSVYMPLGQHICEFVKRGEQPVEFHGVKQRAGFGGAFKDWTNPGFEDQVIVHEFGHTGQGARRFTDLDTTPTIVGAKYWLVEYSAPTDIEYFDGWFFVLTQNIPRDGWDFTLEALNGNATIKHNPAKIITSTGADMTLVAGKLYKFICRGGVWRMY